jgi:hypothetical protein
MFKNKLTSKENLLLLFTIILSIVFLFVGCDKAKETVEDTANTVKEKAETVVEQAAEKIDSVAKEAESIVSEKILEGTWTGKLEGKSTELTITMQDGNDFEGKIVIHTKTVTNQEVKGTYDPATKSIKMEDQLRSRYKGKYAGKISDDLTTFSGTFTTIVDKNTANFKLVKK